MVSHRCLLKVKEELEKLDFEYNSLKLGEVNVSDGVRMDKIDLFRENLHASGLEIIEDSKKILVEKIKSKVLAFLNLDKDIIEGNFSNFLQDNLNLNYVYMSNVFSKCTGVTLSSYVLHCKIEKAKELISYGELNISEISYKLHFSSVPHFSYAFKKISGTTPSGYRNDKQKKRFFLENLVLLANRV